MEAKRKFDNKDNNNVGALVIKKQKTDIIISNNQTSSKNGEIIPQGPARTSKLSAPTLLLTGHGAEVYTAKFDPSGKYLASGSFDKKIFLWEVYGENENVGVLDGHKNAVLEVCWSQDGSQVYSVSADKTACIWDIRGIKRIRKFTEHTSVVNACCPSRNENKPMLLTGSDDGIAKLWDVRVKRSVQSYEHKFQVTSVAFGQDSTNLLFTGGLDNIIRAWDIRQHSIAYELTNHRETITGLRVSPDGSYLLSNSMDNTLHIYDVRPYASGNRCIKDFSGNMHGFDQNLLKCSWSPDGSKISAGSADRFVTIWDTATREILYKLPGHSGTVNEVDFHPVEPIIVSCGADTRIYLGEMAEQ